MTFIVNYPLFEEFFKLMYNVDNQYEIIQILEFQLNKNM